MIFGLFILAVAIFISGVSAFYSVTGLTAIFAAAFWPIVIMGGALEIGKITATVWLHKYWHRATWQFKLYLIPAIVILMLITSMGTYGYLAKAHLDQNLPSGDFETKVNIIDEKINIEQEVIQQYRRDLELLNNQIDKYNQLGAVSKGVKVRQQQKQERTEILEQIDLGQTKISNLREERAKVSSELRQIEAEVGPIKYIAALIYGDQQDDSTLERAVRGVIILLVLVFDPLAIVLILSGEQTIQWAQADKKNKLSQSKNAAGWHQEWVPDTEAWPPHDPDFLDIEEIKKQSGVDQDLEMTETLFGTEQEFFDHGKEIARNLDKETFDFDKHAYLNKPWVWAKGETKEGWVPKPEIEEEPVSEDPLDIPVLEGEEMWAQDAIDNSQYDPQPIRPVPPPADDPEPIVSGYNAGAVTIPDFGITDRESPGAQAGFGTAFPVTPQRGDMFLRVDYLPSRLYKWNDKKWIEVDKEKTDQLAYDQLYIKHLIEKIDLGEYDIELLTDTEKEQIQRYLNDPANKQ